MDYLSIPRVLGKVRVGAWIRRLVTAGRHDNTSGRAIFPQGGSTITQKNRDGSILAETGGRQVYQGRATSYSDFNRVRKSLRQPGSTMKPIVYLAAFRHRDFSLETLVPDEPIQVPGGPAGDEKWISNYDGVFKGLIPIREALAESRNAVAVWITTQIGIDAVLRTSRSLGVQTPLQRFATTALGASEVNLLELATAYRTIASPTGPSPSSRKACGASCASRPAPRMPWTRAGFRLP